MKRWRNIPFDADHRRQVWCDDNEFRMYSAQLKNLSLANLAPYDWKMIHKSRDDGPLFYYPDEDKYVWFFNNEMMEFDEWFSYISLDLGNGPRRTEEEQAMLVLQYA